jgi:hypothetical protein
VSISKQEPAELSCPSCGRSFEADQWMLIDSSERPDLRDALLEGGLNTASCPHCATTFQASVPLLLHDPTLQRVYFAVPYDTEEHTWRTQAQELLYALVAELPEDARLPYLGDVQVEWGIDGVQRALTRKQRRGPQRKHGATQPVAAPVPEPTPIAQTELFDHVQELLAVENPQEFQNILQRHPALRSVAADAILETLAHEARQYGQTDAALAINQVRAMLRAEHGEAPSPPVVAVRTEPEDEHLFNQHILSQAAYQAFLAAATPIELQDAVRDHPALLEPWAEALLHARAEAALDAGHEALAVAIGQQNEFLHALRLELNQPGLLQHAISELLAARSEEPIAQVLAEYPALLTRQAQELLGQHYETARNSGDTPRAEYLAQCQRMLRNVRNGMDVGM